MTHFVVHAINGSLKGQIACQSSIESRTLFQARLRTLDPFQRFRDIGSDRPAESVKGMTNFLARARSLL